MVERSWPAMMAWPDVRESRPARQCSSVDLPEPEGPMMAVKWPRRKDVDTWSRAMTALSLPMVP
jgi:hypothetical protein